MSFGVVLHVLCFFCRYVFSWEKRSNVALSHAFLVHVLCDRTHSKILRVCLFLGPMNQQKQKKTDSTSFIMFIVWCKVLGWFSGLKNEHSSIWVTMMLFPIWVTMSIRALMWLYFEQFQSFNYVFMQWSHSVTLYWVICISETLSL
jgi:hypothetical protein